MLIQEMDPLNKANQKILNEKLNNQGAVNGEKATNESKKPKLNVDLYEFLQDSWRADDSKRKDTNS